MFIKSVVTLWYRVDVFVKHSREERSPIWTRGREFGHNTHIEKLIYERCFISATSLFYAKILPFIYSYQHNMSEGQV